MPKMNLRHAFVAVMITLAMLVQGTWALAGTTGNITGTLTDKSSGKPVANARVTALSPSQSASTTTDAGGHFTLLNLAPDTYSVSVDKDGYAATSIAGVTVFADQSQTLAITTEPIKTIARVTSRAAGNLVKPGVTADTYSVNAAGAQAAAGLGGGGNLDSAYSAIASVPGVNVPIGGAGWNNNAVFIRGNQSFFTSFEYDGVPVNRAFDNYNSSTESSLGLQELQVYTGGGPASNSSAGTSGFVNQVIKTGTYPGFGGLSFGLGAPAYYHKAMVEAGGASPNRNFSYYVGVSGYNQGFRYLDQKDGASLFNLGNTFDYWPQYTELVGSKGTNGRGVWPVCDAGTNVSPITSNTIAGFGYGGQCFIYNPASALFGNLADIADRENVVNLHFGIPHANGLRDDLQVLWSASAMDTTYYSSPNDAGGLANYTLAVTGFPYDPAANYPSYVDALNDYNLPFGTPIQPNGVPLPTMTYFQPSSNPNRQALAQVPLDNRDTIRNDTGIVKLQYTKSLSSNAYARIFGYTFFSDWTQAGADMAWNCYVWGYGGPNDCGVAQNYDLITHTTGGEFQLADQFNSKNLLELTANYTTATSSRFNNTGYIFDYFFGGSPVGLVSHNGGQYQCFDNTFNPTNCLTFINNPSYTAGDLPMAEPAAGSPAANAGAQWVTLQNGDTYGTYNTVKPKFLFTSLTDEFHPTDKLSLNVGLRWDRYEYDLPPLTPGTDFFAQIEQTEVCQNQQTGAVLTTPLKPGQAPPAPVYYTTDCSVGPGGAPITGYAHPKFSATSPSTYILQSLSPRLSFSYMLSPETVIRGEAGKYTEPPISASLQYLNSSGNTLSVWNATLPLGFNSPFHPIPLMSALQADLSLEHQFHGTDITAKLSPFYDYTSGYQQQAFIGPNFVTQVPVGAFRSYGLEAAISKGDFNRDGLSGQLAVTWTDAKVQYEQKYFGKNQIQNADAAIAQFNTLTKGGGGSQCYSPAVPATKTSTAVLGTPDSCSDPHAILNPYYNLPEQQLLDVNGWYAPGGSGLDPASNPSVGYFDSPLVSSLILNYKHDKFSITPSFQVSEGSAYGGPFDATGLDPRACSQNSADAGIVAVSGSTNPQQCNYLSLITGNGSPTPVAGQFYVPDPQTGFFAKPGQFRNPWVATMNLQLRYEISPKVTAIATLADVWHTCFGGQSEPWTKGRYAPGANICDYYSNGLYTSNFYNGTSPSDAAANGVADQYWQTQSYLPSFYGSTGSGNPWPFNAYFQLQIKL